MGEIPESVYEAAARAYANELAKPQQLGHYLADQPPLRAAVDSAYSAGVAAGRAQAAADIRAAVLADMKAPVPKHNGYQHQGAEWAARIAEGGDRCSQSSTT